jgi:transposase
LGITSTATRNGVSGKELQRQLGVTYKCAWRIGHQIRNLMAARDKANTPEQLSGQVEIDETYVGGRKRTGENRAGKQIANWRDNKSCVMGMVERGGAFKGQVVPDNKRVNLLPVVLKNIAYGATAITDELASYKKLSKLGYKHEFIRHGLKEYVRGDVHTNRIEGFWSHLKRGISSTHVSVSRKHLQKYVNEFAFRYNNRHAPADMFSRMLAQVSIPS